MVTINRVRVTWTGVAGTPWYTNLYSINPAVTPATHRAAANALLTGLKAQFIPAVTGNIEGDVALIDTATGNIVGVDSGVATQVAGTATGTPLPPATQGLVRLLTGVYAGGRQIRGKVFWPGLSTNASNGGVPIATFMTALNTGFTAYLTTLGPAAVVYSRKNGTAASIASANTWTQFAVLRSRRD